MSYTANSNIPVVAASQVSLPSNEDFTLFFDTENSLHLTAVKNVAGVATFHDYEIVPLGGLVYKGVIDASTNPNFPAATIGDLYMVSVAGTICGEKVNVGDMVISIAIQASGCILTNWDIIEGGFSLNLQNNTGVDGLQQLSVLTPNNSSGDHSAVFGENNTESGADNLVGGDSHTVAGNENFVAGTSNTVTGNNNNVTGLSNIVVGDLNNVSGTNNTTIVGSIQNNISGTTIQLNGNSNSVSGNTNNVLGNNNNVSGTIQNISGANNIVGGDNNNVVGDSNNISGSGNSLASGNYNISSGNGNVNTAGNNNVITGNANINTIGDNNILSGFSNVITGANGRNIISGDNNTINGGFNNIVSGNNNVNTGGSHNFINGQNHTVFGSGNLVIGNNQTISGADNIVGGILNTADAARGLITGQSNSININSVDSAIVGGNTNALVNAVNSVILGGNGITETEDNFATTPNLRITEQLYGSANANKILGEAILVAGTLAVANTSITATSLIFLSRRVAGGVVGNLTYTRNAGVGFTIDSDNVADTSTISYLIVQVTP